MTIQSNLLTPFTAVEIDASNASQGPALLSYSALVIGQRLSTGSAAADTIVPCSSVADAILKAGRGSMLHRQAVAWFAANTSVPLYLGVLDDDGAGVAASGTITVSGPATADGTVVLYLGGERITVGVTSGDTADDVAAAINTAINAALDLPVTSTVLAEVVTVTFRHKGLVGNSYDMRDSYRDDESLPSGVGLVYVPLASGTTNPTITSLITAMGDTWWQIWSHPYTDATSLTAIENELSSRFGPLRMIDGLAITSAADTLANLTTLGNGRNSPHNCIVAQPGESPLTPPMEFAAEVAGVVALYGQDDPARPFQTLSMSRALPPAETELFTREERNNLLTDGIGTTLSAAGGQARLERIITTYQTNAAAAPDTAYRDATVMLTLLYLRYSFRVRMQTRYPRHKLADDGAIVGPGQFVLTPKGGAGEAVTWFREMEQLGLVENFDQFQADLVVARSVTDPNRLEFFLPSDLINFLAVTAATIGFRL